MLWINAASIGIFYNSLLILYIKYFMLIIHVKATWKQDLIFASIYTKKERATDESKKPNTTVLVTFIDSSI